jgi:peptidoglycan/xylan/chitin deacetylase (PgdA/CDA1 family)
VIHKQDWATLAFHRLGYAKIRSQIFKFLHRPAVQFIAYHNIAADQAASFEYQMRFLQEHTKVISLADFFFGNLTTARMNIVITFDDGFKSWITVAIPLLERFNMPAAFFISSGFVSLTFDKEREYVANNLRIHDESHPLETSGLTVDDIKAIVRKGFTVGGHTLNHCDLSELHDPDTVRYEINEDKLKLERITNTSIEYFAFPMGACNNSKVNILQILQQAGYKGAVTTKPGLNAPTTNPYMLKRQLVSTFMPPDVFKSRVLGNYEAVLFLKQPVAAMSDKFKQLLHIG